MVKVLRYLSRFLPWADPYAEAKRAARLSEAEALAIARRASPNVPDEYNLHFAALAREDGEWVWVFSTSVGEHVKAQKFEQPGRWRSLRAA